MLLVAALFILPEQLAKVDSEKNARTNGRTRGKLHGHFNLTSAETNSAIFEYSIVTVPFECPSTYTNYLGKYVIGPHVMFTCFEMASSSKSCVKSRLLRSPVWDYFKVFGDKKVRCKLCVPPAATTLAYHGGTTSMQSHLSSHHPDKYGETTIVTNYLVFDR